MHFETDSNTKHKLHAVYFKYVLQILAFQLLHNPVYASSTVSNIIHAPLFVAMTFEFLGRVL